MAKGGIAQGLMKAKGRGLAKAAAQKASGGGKSGNPFANIKKGGGNPFAKGKGKMAPPFGKKRY